MSEPPPREPDDDRTPVPVRERGDGYFRNGTWVPRGTEPDPQPPGWREQVESRLGISLDDRRLWMAAGGVLALLILVVVIVNAGSPTRRPQEERDFLTAVKHGQTAVKDGNDITLVTAARDRASAVCALLPRGGAVEDWVGTISRVGTVFGGKQGQLEISLGNDVHVRTWSRASEDAKDHTLVDPNSDVYRALADLKSDDQVRFSGSFVPRGATCVHETSLFARNGMLTPSFVFRFTEVGPR
jgi:hypothetical protein